MSYPHEEVYKPYMYLSHMYPTADGDTLPLVRMDAARHCPRAQYAGSTQSFRKNVEPQEIPKHGSLINVSGIREGEKKDEEGEIKGETRGRRGWHTRTQKQPRLKNVLHTGPV